jgi:uncharacterized protein (TIGR03086 family)
MTDDLTSLSQLIDELTELVDGTGDAQLGDKTPCTEWTVRDLLNHIVTGGILFGRSAEEGGLSPQDAALLQGDNLGADFRAAWRESSQRALAAFGRPGVLDDSTVIPLPFGAMPAPAALHLALFDLTVHAVDLSLATGQDRLSAEVLGRALEVGPGVVRPAFRAPGIFNPVVPVAGDAPLVDRLAAFAGREPW